METVTEFDFGKATIGSIPITFINESANNQSESPSKIADLF